MSLTFQLLRQSSSLHRQLLIVLLQGKQSVYDGAYRTCYEMKRNASRDLHLSSSLVEELPSTHRAKPLNDLQLLSSFLTKQGFQLQQQSFPFQPKSVHDEPPLPLFQPPS